MVILGYNKHADLLITLNVGIGACKTAATFASSYMNARGGGYKGREESCISIFMLSCLDRDKVIRTGMCLQVH